MRLTTLDNLDVGAGRLYRWPVRIDGDGEAHPVGPSENERFHLDAVAAGGSGWLAVTFEIDSGELPILRAAFEAVLRHHEVLRAWFVLDDGVPQRRLCPPSALTVHEPTAVDVPDPDGAKARIGDAVIGGCSALTPGSHLLAAVDHGATSTVVCAFDHCYIDAHSLAVIVEDVRTACAGDPLTAAGGFLDQQADVAVADEPAEDDPRVVAWGDFLAAADWTIPQYPLDLGVAPGEFAPARIRVDTVLSAAEAWALTTPATDLAGPIRCYPALLAALAVATRRLGGPSRLPLVIPVHTRRDDRWSRSVGWFVANAPLILTGGCDGVADPCVDPARAVEYAVRSATETLHDALPLGEVELSTVYRTFGHRLRKPRHDVFMVSYLDYRRFDLPERLDAHHVSSDGRADTLQMWFWRDHTGVHLRTRHPDTPTARSVVTAVVDDLIDLVRGLAVSPTERAVPDRVGTDATPAGHRAG
ncbi:condensation domain-containing protein [Williamsia sterculiae]|uniref:Condensation domain-containing protein n=1 Tax=Williamsia sterculiae TaxID=1344003 RepID=A0A1N7DZH8_9NOCA|nr:hypothetical protein [Williamsia sterculiae]SIR81208.1 Condensation domain-containing protein [Williamsia sterculiae]